MYSLYYKYYDFLYIPAGSGLSPDVRITVAGGLVLTGNHCPGFADITCDGISLTFLKWTFNDDIEIQTYPPDRPVQTSNVSLPLGSIVKVTLSNVAQYTNSPQFANFTSVLTVSLEELERENIQMISCGDPGTTSMLPVAVTIQRYIIPYASPISQVIATFASNELDSVRITWNPSPVSLINTFSPQDYNYITRNKIN